MDSANVLRLPTPTHGAAYYAEKRKMVYCERQLWPALATRGFRAQVAFGPYIADFLSLRDRVCVEVDGPSHLERAAQDAARDRFFVENGFRVVRVTNAQVKKSLSETLAAVFGRMGDAAPNRSAEVALKLAEPPKRLSRKAKRRRARKRKQAGRRP